MLNRSNNMTIQQIKEEIEKLKGKRINMSVNQGRKKYVNFEGVIQDTYTSIFVVRLLESTKGMATQLNETKKRQKLSNIAMTQKEPVDNEVKYDCPPIIEIPNNNNVDLRTYSYIDILCGNVDIEGFMS